MMMMIMKMVTRMEVMVVNQSIRNNSSSPPTARMVIHDQAKQYRAVIVDQSFFSVVRSHFPFYPEKRTLIAYALDKKRIGRNVFFRYQYVQRSIFLPLAIHRTISGHVHSIQKPRDGK